MASSKEDRHSKVVCGKSKISSLLKFEIERINRSSFMEQACLLAPLLSPKLFIAVLKKTLLSLTRKLAYQNGYYFHVDAFR